MSLSVAAHAESIDSRRIVPLLIAPGSALGKDEAGNSKEETEFHRLVAFGKLAEFAGQYLQKGRAIYAEGRLRTNKWEDTGGQKHSRTEVVLSELQFVGQKPKEAAAA